jgi:1-deoxyxylulose-5-phosphate synthase
MDYVKLGRTGLDISRLCLGCMTYGAPDRGRHPWTLPEGEARPLIQRALEAGINFFDTANSYSDGTSEEILGRAMRDFARRDEVVIATKRFFPWRPGPNGGGLSRKAIFTAVDASLVRLARCIGASSMAAWQFSKALHVAERPASRGRARRWRSHGCFRSRW